MLVISKRIIFWLEWDLNNYFFYKYTNTIGASKFNLQLKLSGNKLNILREDESFNLNADSRKILWVIFKNLFYIFQSQPWLICCHHKLSPISLFVSKGYIEYVHLRSKHFGIPFALNLLEAAILSLIRAPKAWSIDFIPAWTFLCFS